MNEVFVAPPLDCDTAGVTTPIYTIQGSGASSLLDGSAVVIDGIVVATSRKGMATTPIWTGSMSRTRRVTAIPLPPMASSSLPPERLMSLSVTQCASAVSLTNFSA
jgi:hypothetical protein